MATVNPTRLLNLGLLALAAFLGAFLVLQAWQGWGSGSPTELVAPVRRPTPAARVLGPPRKPPAKSSSRDPFAPPRAGSARMITNGEERLEVLGVVISASESLVLARRGGPQAEIKRLGPGDRLGSYRIEKIMADRVVLRKEPGGPQREIILRKQEVSSSASPAPTAKPSPPAPGKPGALTPPPGIKLPPSPPGPQPPAPVGRQRM